MVTFYSYYFIDITLKRGIECVLYDECYGSDLTLICAVLAHDD